MTHELKCWPIPFRAIEDGSKRHEVRIADRPFHEGDVARLREFDPSCGRYTGRERAFLIGHVTHGGAWGLPENLCVFSLVKECDVGGLACGRRAPKGFL